MGGVKVAALYAALGLDKKDYDKGLDSAESRSRAWSGKIGGIFKTAGKVIAIGLAVGLAAIAAIGAASLQNAEDQERANARVEQVFGKNSKAVNNWATNMSRQIGVADDVLQNAQAKYAQFATNSGISLEEASKSGQELIIRAEEIARSTGQSFDDVFNKLMKGVQGSTRGLKEFGVQAGPTTIEHEALRLGLIKQGEALDDNARTLALQSLIMQQTASYTGSAAEATDSFAFKQRQMGVMVDEVMDTIGVIFMELAQVVMPILVDAMAGLATWVTDNMPTIQAVIETAVAVIGAVFKFITEEVLPPLMSVLGALFSGVQENAPTISAIFTAVFDTVSDVIDFVVRKVIPPLVEIIQMVVKWVSQNWPIISSVFGQVFGAVANTIKVVWPIVANVAKVLFPLVSTAATILFHALDFVFKAIGGVFEVFGAVAKAVFQAVTGIWKGLSGFFEKHLGGVGDAFRAAVNFIIDIVNGFLGFLNNLKIDIPRVKVGPIDVGGGSIDPFNFPLIPKLARGGIADGLAWVGEEGPELVDLPAGSRVHSARESRAMMAQRMEITIRDGDGSLARGGYSQDALERAVTKGVRALLGDAQHLGARA